MEALKNRLKFIQIFEKNASLPKTRKDCLNWFQKIYFDLSPESLTCDGEYSPKEVDLKLKNLKQEWAELEEIYGEKLSIKVFESMLFNKDLLE